MNRRKRRSPAASPSRSTSPAPALALSPATRLVTESGRAPDFPLTFAQSPGRDLDRACDFALALTSGEAHDLDLVFARACHSASCPACGAEAESLRELKRRMRGLADLPADNEMLTRLLAIGEPGGPDHHTAAPQQAGRPRARVVPSAARLARIAVRLLPTTDRVRYAEEFRSELAELARTEAGRWGQLAYAARQAGSALRLRAALRAPARRRAAS